MANRLHFTNCFIVLAAGTWVAVSCLINSTAFTISPFCLTDSCALTDVRKVRSQVECASQCSLTESCVGFLYPHTAGCSLLRPDCFSSPRCFSNDPTLHLKILSPQDCQHESTLRESRLFCQCVDGWVGILCQRLPHSCDDLYAYGYPYGHQRSAIDLYGDQSFIIYTSCYGNEYNTVTFLLINYGSKENNMSKLWDEYVHGFNTTTGSFWIGLKSMLALNEMGSNTVFFEVHVSRPGQSDFMFMQYHGNFTLQDESRGYAFTSQRLHPERVQRTDFLTNSYELEDVLGMSSGLPFLTPDRDNAQGCAALAGTGWWFPDCSDGLKLNVLSYMPWANKEKEIILPGLDMSDSQLRNRIGYIAMSFILEH